MPLSGNQFVYSGSGTFWGPAPFYNMSPKEAKRVSVCCTFVQTTTPHTVSASESGSTNIGDTLGFRAQHFTSWRVNSESANLCRESVFFLGGVEVRSFNTNQPGWPWYLSMSACFEESNGPQPSCRRSLKDADFKLKHLTSKQKGSQYKNHHHG